MSLIRRWIGGGVDDANPVAAVPFGQDLRHDNGAGDGHEQCAENEKRDIQHGRGESMEDRVDPRASFNQ